MGRKNRTKDVLRTASDHFHYEYGMFGTLARAMSTGVFGEGALNNAVLESFIIHARAVMDFLYSKSPHVEDIIAEDFFDEPDDWRMPRPKQTDVLVSARKRVGTEVAHLSYERQNVTPEKKPWPLSEITIDVAVVARKFLDVVPEDFLGERWDEYKKTRASATPTDPPPPLAPWPGEAAGVTNSHPSLRVNVE